MQRKAHEALAFKVCVKSRYELSAVKTPLSRRQGGGPCGHMLHGSGEIDVWSILGG